MVELDGESSDSSDCELEFVSPNTDAKMGKSD